MLWLSPGKRGRILSNRHSLPRLICFFVSGEDSSPLHSASFQNDSCHSCRALHTLCVSFLTSTLTNTGALGIFGKIKPAGETEDDSPARLRGSCYNKSGCGVIGPLFGLG